MSSLTGHPVVDAVSKLHFQGNTVHHSWYQHIRYANKRGEFTDHVACLILADIVYWYRPVEIRNELSGHIIGYRKKFAEDKLQRNPEAFAKLLGCSEKVARDALRLLENLEIIEIELRAVRTAFGTIPTTMFIGLNPERLEQITHPLSKPETPIKSLLPKSVTRNAQIGKKECPNGKQALPISVTSLTEMGNSSIYRDYTENTHTTALANATPAAHPSVCVASQAEEKNQEVNLPPDRVDHQKENIAHAQDSNLGQDSAAATEISINTQKPKKRRTTQSASQGKWHCPGAAEEKLEFLKWKGSLLVAAGKASKAEAESAALAWANRHPEEASLAYEGWKRELNKEKSPVSETALQVVAGIPDFSIKPKAWHEELIRTYQREGEEAFLDRENWHKDWLKFAKTYLTQQLKKAQGAS